MHSFLNKSFLIVLVVSQILVEPNITLKSLELLFLINILIPLVFGALLRPINNSNCRLIVLVEQ